MNWSVLQKATDLLEQLDKTAAEQLEGPDGGENEEASYLDDDTSVEINSQINEENGAAGESGIVGAGIELFKAPDAKLQR